MKKNTDFLGTENVNRLLFRLALPCVAAQLVNMLYNIVDRIYIGHLPDEGTTALTGIGVCFPIIMMIAAFTGLVGSGGAPKASIELGRGNKELAEKILGNCFTSLLIESVVLMTVFYIYKKPILLLFGASENTLPYAVEYLNIYLIGTFAAQLGAGLNTFITAQGFTTVAMCSIVIGAVINAVLDPIFIFAMGMGVKGAAIATVIAQSATAVWVLYFLFGKKTVLRIKKKNMKLCASCILPCLALGLSPFIMQSTESALYVSFNASLYKYGGDIAVGAMSVISSVMQFAWLPALGITQGAQPIISYNLGAENGDRVKATFKSLFICCICYSSVVWLTAMLMPQLYVGAFTNDTNMIEYASGYLRIYMAATIMSGIQMACQQTFLALGNARTSLFLALLRKVVLLIPLIFILPSIIKSDQITAVYLAEPIADFISISTTGIMFIISFKNTMIRLNAKKALNS